MNFNMIENNELQEKWSELHNEIVQKVIDFCKEHNITEATDFVISADGLNESIEYGYWTPGTDSSMALEKLEFVDGKRTYKKLIYSI